MTLRPSEHGNVLFYILIAVVLFAALGFAVSKSSVGTKNISDEKAKLVTSEMIDYAGALRQAVSKLRLRGCNDTQISFENSATGATFSNPSSPSSGNRDCWIFDTNGAGATYKTFSDINYSIVGYSSMNGIGPGTTTTDKYGKADLYLMATLYDEPGKKLCETFNTVLGNTDFVPLPSTTYLSGGPAFTGTFGPDLVSNSTSIMFGKRAACNNYSPVPTLSHFWYVLLER